jgi:hypothetical protein
MRSLIIASLVMILAPASPALAWKHDLSSTHVFLFDRDHQAHPKKLLIAVPIMQKIVGAGGGPLTIGASVGTGLWGDDLRRNKGKVIVRARILREEAALWKKKMRARVENASTHGLCAFAAFDDNLQPGDLVLFQFTFKGFPRFDPSEAVHVQGRIQNDIEDPEGCKY